jgi:hypothetical protein
MKRLSILAALLLAGCATDAVAPAKDIVVPVDKPIAASCVPTTVGDAPDYAKMKADAGAAVDLVSRYHLIARDFVVLVDRAAVVEPVIASCRGPAK